GEVEMGKEGGGLGGIERSVLERRQESAPEGPPPAVDQAEAATPGDPAGDVVLDYCAAVRGILNDDQGGPLHPPGLRMAEALDEVRASIRRDLDEKKGGSRSSNSAAWPAASTGASTKSGPNKRRSASTPRTSR